MLSCEKAKEHFLFKKGVFLLGRWEKKHLLEKRAENGDERGLTELLFVTLVQTSGRFAVGSNLPLLRFQYISTGWLVFISCRSSF